MKNMLVRRNSRVGGKKHIRLSLLCLLLIPFNNYASCEDGDNALEQNDIINEQIRSLIPYATGAAAYISAKACGSSPFGAIASCYLATRTTDILTTKNESIQDSFPYTKKWYNELHNKYPDVALDKKIFNMHPRSSSRGWQATHNTISCKNIDAQMINGAYEKKCNNEQLSDDESDILSLAEWTILHEATHINNQDAPTWVTVQVGAIAGIESLFHVYNKKMNINAATRSLPKGFCLCLAMIPVSHILCNTYSRMFEARADKYANEHADITILPAAQNWFKERKYSNSQLKFIKKINTITSTHPSDESRLKAIDDEIVRRTTKTKKESLCKNI